MSGSEYPAWVCAPCGHKYGRRKCGVATWHEDDCGVCGKRAVVTEPRDFGHLRPSFVFERGTTGGDGLDLIGGGKR